MSELREIEGLLKRLAVSLERIEAKVCGPRPPKTPMTPEAIELWGQVMRGGLRVPGERGADDLPPNGGVPPEEFWRRPDEDAHKLKRRTRSE